MICILYVIFFYLPAYSRSGGGAGAFAHLGQSAVWVGPLRISKKGPGRGGRRPREHRVGRKEEACAEAEEEPAEEGREEPERCLTLRRKLSTARRHFSKQYLADWGVKFRACPVVRQGGLVFLLPVEAQ